MGQGITEIEAARSDRAAAPCSAKRRHMMVEEGYGKVFVALDGTDQQDFVLARTKCSMW